MALFRGTLRSAALRMDTNVSVILPCESNLAHLAPLDKTVILLHGLKQNSDSWVRMSRVERFAALTGFNVIMPEVQLSVCQIVSVTNGANGWSMMRIC